MNYRSDRSLAIGRADARLLEVSSARAVVRSESFYGTSSAILPGVKGIGDWTVHAAGRMSLHWRRTTTSAIDTQFDQLHLNVRLQAAAPLNGWAGFTQPPTDLRGVQSTK